ncbi:MAG: CidA/LrgA family protein [Chitinophagaceae bacterium]|nr:CidA/LrgA family protein [Rubrivivax sp.]
MEGLRGLALLLLCQSAGELLARAFGLPLPGPVLGLLLLWGLLWWPPLRAPAAAVAEPLLTHLSLLFVPVGVGVVTHLALISQYGGRIALALVASTLVGLAVTALVLRALLRAQGVVGADAPAAPGP